jgi:hypothetical protein
LNLPFFGSFFYFLEKIIRERRKNKL